VVKRRQALSPFWLCYVNGYFLASRRCFIDIGSIGLALVNLNAEKNVNKNYTEESIRGGKLLPSLAHEHFFSGMESEILH
jgi:hypothetical protein